MINKTDTFENTKLTENEQHVTKTAKETILFESKLMLNKFPSAL